MEIIKKTSFECWKAALKEIMDSGHDYKDIDKRLCRQMLNLVIKILNPAEGITKPVETLNGFKKWVYPPLDEIANIILARKLAPAYDYSYGPRLFNFNGAIDQVNDFLIPMLKNDPTSRRGVVVIWNPLMDSNIYKNRVPSLMMLDFKLQKNKLHVVSIVRSSDMFFGWPANIYQIFVLQNYVREKLGCELGTLTTFSTSAHIFDDQFEDIEKVVG